MIKSLDSSLEPETIHCDYEKAAITAMREVFPRTRIAGRYFHLASNMRKHVAHQLVLMEKYGSEPHIACYAKMIPSLAFVPPEEVENAFNALGSRRSRNLRRSRVFKVPYLAALKTPSRLSIEAVAAGNAPIARKPLTRKPHARKTNSHKESTIGPPGVRQASMQATLVCFADAVLRHAHPNRKRAIYFIGPRRRFDRSFPQG